MQKLTKKLSLVMVALMTVFTALSYMPAKAATVAPKVQFVGNQKTEFTAGERITFDLNAANYGGRVQYRVVLWNDATKSYSDLWNTADRYYANWMPYGNETLPLGWIINEPGTYRITVYVKRAGLANNKTATPAANCDSYQAGPAFVVKSAVSAESKTADYEKAPLTTAEEIVAAEALRAEAVALIAELTSETEKAALTARVEAQDKILEEAKYVHVEAVDGTNLNTVKVTFNKEVAANVKNYKIYEKNNPYYTLVVDSVTVNKETATIKVFDTLVADKTYVVEVSGAASADTKFAMKEMESNEFVFKIVDAASIAFNSVKVPQGTRLGYTIKDANGNDVTANYVLGTDVLVEVADATVINNTTLTAKTLASGAASEYTIVNLKIDDTEIQTGNTIIEVTSEAAIKLTQLGRMSLGTTDYDEAVTSLFESDSATAVNVELLDQYAKTMTIAPSATFDYTFISSNPTVAIADNTTDTITPVSKGSTILTVVATLTDGTGAVLAKVSKAYTVTVKADAVATKLTVDKTSVTVVGESGLNETINLKVLDQYGNVFSSTNTLDLVVGTAGKVTTGGSLTLTAGETDVTVEGTVADATGTTKLTFTYGSLPSVVVVANNVAAGAFSGYLAEAEDIKLDQLLESDPLYDTLGQGPNNTTISVYAKDIYGHKISLLGTGFTFTSLQTVEASKVVDVNAVGSVALRAGKTGTETIAVKVGTTTIANITFTVVDSTPVLTKVVQAKDTLSIAKNATDADVKLALFGNLTGATPVYGVFKGYDQYSDDIAIAGYTVLSTNTSLINFSTGTFTLGANATGKVTLVISVNDEFKTIEVIVQ